MSETSLDDSWETVSVYYWDYDANDSRDLSFVIEGTESVERMINEGTSKQEVESTGIEGATPQADAVSSPKNPSPPIKNLIEHFNTKAEQKKADEFTPSSRTRSNSTPLTKEQVELIEVANKPQRKTATSAARELSKKAKMAAAAKCTYYEGVYTTNNTAVTEAINKINPILNESQKTDEQMTTLDEEYHYLMSIQRRISQDALKVSNYVENMEGATAETSTKFTELGNKYTRLDSKIS